MTSHYPQPLIFKQFSHEILLVINYSCNKANITYLLQRNTFEYTYDPPEISVSGRQRASRFPLARTFQFSSGVSYLVSRKLSPILHIIKHPRGELAPPGGEGAEGGLNDGERSAPPPLESGTLVSCKIFPRSLFSVDVYNQSLVSVCVFRVASS